MVQVRIREQAFVARLAAIKLRSNSVAIVFGKTIYLWNASREDLLNNTKWLRHEVAHVHQWNREGYFKFLMKYLIYSIQFGYKNNPYEIEAAEAENDPTVLDNVELPSII